MSQLDASASAVTDFEDLLPRRSQRSLLRRFSRHRLAAVGLGILLIFGFLATFAPIVSVYDPNFTNLDILRESPSLSHPLGTDAAGRIFDPEISKSIEAGVKLTLMNGALTGTFTVYQLEKDNVLASDINNPGFSVAIGEG